MTGVYALDYVVASTEHYLSERYFIGDRVDGAEICQNTRVLLPISCVFACYVEAVKVYSSYFDQIPLVSSLESNYMRKS